MGNEKPNSEGVISKKKLVEALAEKIRNSKTVLIASIKGLPSAQFQEIKKKLRGKAEVRVVKKSAVLRAIEKVEKGAVQNLKEKIGADVALFFSELDAFELSGLLSENQSSTRAKAGDVAPEDIKIEPGPTSLIPGPAISELSSVGLKVAVEGGKIAIKQGATVVKSGGEINDKVAGVLGKLGIEPMKVGFEPIAAYDSASDRVFVGIKIDRKKALEELREALGKALGFAVNVEYFSKETIGYFIARAGVQEKALSALTERRSAEEGREEKKDE